MTSKETEYGYQSDAFEVYPGFKITVYTQKMFPDICSGCKKSMLHDKDKKLEGFTPSFFCSDACRTKVKEERERIIKWMEDTNFVEKLHEEMARIAKKYPLKDLLNG